MRSTAASEVEIMPCNALSTAFSATTSGLKCRLELAQSRGSLGGICRHAIDVKELSFFHAAKADDSAPSDKRTRLQASKLVGQDSIRDI
jgi:hypothetical protein